MSICPRLILVSLLALVNGIKAETTNSSSSPGFVHQDARCMCKCPDVGIVRDDMSAYVQDRIILDTSRSIYINSSVTPQDCDCQHVVLGYLDLTNAQADAFCPR